jgi:hypothetical protein
MCTSDSCLEEECFIDLYTCYGVTFSYRYNKELSVNVYSLILLFVPDI